jgi:hypothetical protein
VILKRSLLPSRQRSNVKAWLGRGKWPESDAIPHAGATSRVRLANRSRLEWVFEQAPKQFESDNYAGGKNTVQRRDSCVPDKNGATQS